MHSRILAPASVRLLVVTCLTVGGTLLAAHSEPPRAGRPAQFSARTEMVEVYATVTDDKGRLVTDLTQDDFLVQEDGRPQTVVTFTPGNVPVSLALAFDRSFSMRGAPLDAARTAARVLLNELTDDDRVTLIAVGSEVDVVVPLTNDRLAIDQAVHALDAWGSTALHDAVVQAVDAIEPAPGRRALVLVSDGMERHSLRTAEDVYARIRQSDVMIYPVAFARRMPPVFRAMAALSGGRASVTRNPEELARLFRRFAEELRHQYLLGYTPDGPETPGYRAIAVRVRRPGLTVRARAGYTVPSR